VSDFSRRADRGRDRTRFSRQHDIEDYQVRPVLPDDRQGLRAVAAIGNFVAFATQSVAQTEANVGVVFHNQDVFFHWGKWMVAR
jgi:hypothetical protein